MPGVGRWRWPRSTSETNWSSQPFSYTKLSYAIPVIVFIVAVAVSFSNADYLPLSLILAVVIVGLAAFAAQIIFLRIVWRLLPSSFRARIPYDSKDARERKGNIKSFWELLKLIGRPHPK